MILLFACATATSPEAPVPDPELSAHLMALNNRVSAAQYEAALPWLVAHADQALPELIVRLREGGPHAERAADCLGRLGRADAVPALAAALDADAILVRGAAGRALARLVVPEALTALTTAVATGSDRAAIAALDGLGARSGEGTCAAIAPGLTREGDVAFHAQRAAKKQGC
jgi:HEAT repeat protein